MLEWLQLLPQMVQQLLTSRAPQGARIRLTCFPRGSTKSLQQLGPKTDIDGGGLQPDSPLVLSLWHCHHVLFACRVSWFPPKSWTDSLALRLLGPRSILLSPPRAKCAGLNPAGDTMPDPFIQSAAQTHICGVHHLPPKPPRPAAPIDAPDLLASLESPK